MVRKNCENIKYYFYCRFKLKENIDECNKIHSEITKLFKEQKIPSLKTLKSWSSSYLKETNIKLRESSFKFDETKQLAFKKNEFQLVRSTPANIKRVQFYSLCRHQLDISRDIIIKELDNLFGDDAPTMNTLSLWISSCRIEFNSFSIVVNRKEASNHEIENLKHKNENLQQQLLKFVKENEFLNTENKRLLQIQNRKIETETNKTDLKDDILIDKAKKEKMDQDILNEFIKRCKEYKDEINQLKLENSSVRTRLNEKFETSRITELNFEFLKEQLDAQNLKLKNLATKYSLEQIVNSTDYLKEIETACESSRLRARNLRRELSSQKSDFNSTLKRLKSRELYYADEIKRLQALNERLTVEMKDRNNSTLPRTSLAKSTSNSIQCNSVKTSCGLDFVVIDDSSNDDKKDNQRYMI